MPWLAAQNKKRDKERTTDYNKERALTADLLALLKALHDLWIHVDQQVVVSGNFLVAQVLLPLRPMCKVVPSDCEHDVNDPLTREL